MKNFTSFLALARNVTLVFQNLQLYFNINIRIPWLPSALSLKYGLFPRMMIKQYIRLFQ